MQITKHGEWGKHVVAQGSVGPEKSLCICLEIGRTDLGMSLRLMDEQNGQRLSREKEEPVQRHEAMTKHEAAPCQAR